MTLQIFKILTMTWKALTMIKLFFLTFIIITNIYAHDHKPSNKTNFSGHDSFIRLFKKTKLLTYKFEYENGRRYKEHKSSSLEFGAYYKMTKAQKIGVFIGEFNGKRHSDDWIVNNGDWHWKDTGERVERFMKLVYIGKYRFSKLDPTLYILKTSYIVNDYNANNTVVLEPGFHYFQLESSVPIWSLKTSIPLYFSVNYDSKDLYKKGLYVSLLKHLDKNFAIGLNFKHLTESWVESTDFLKLTPSDAYSSKDVSQTIGLSIIANL